MAPAGRRKAWVASGQRYGAHQRVNIGMAGVPLALGEAQAVGGNAGQYGLDVFRDNHGAPGNKSPGPCCGKQGQASSRTEPVLEARLVAGGFEHGLNVIEKGRGRVDGVSGPL